MAHKTLNPTSYNELCTVVLLESEKEKMSLDIMIKSMTTRQSFNIYTSPLEFPRT